MLSKWWKQRRWSASASLFSHMQIVGFLMMRLILFYFENFPQYCFIIWTNWWLFRCPLWLNDFPQILQLYGFSPVWTLRCVTSFALKGKILPHIEHGNIFTPIKSVKENEVLQSERCIKIFLTLSDANSCPLGETFCLFIPFWFWEKSLPFDCSSSCSLFSRYFHQMQGNWYHLLLIILTADVLRSHFSNVVP